MFSDLPHSLKGFKRCPDCDVFNGYRAKMCRNKKCGVTFKGCVKKPTVEACTIVTNFTSIKYISVKVRNKGPDYRAFVELNKIHSSQSTSKQNVTIVSARCNVSCCVRSLKSSQVNSASKSPQCTHIQTAMNCSAVAEVLNIKQYIFNLLNISDQMKQQILRLNSHPLSPLVQRVSKSVMVVKTNVTKKNHLGYLHVSFISSKKHQVYSCNCEFNGSVLKRKKQLNAKETNNRQEKGRENISSVNLTQHCIHFYLCVCAFASDRTLYKEFHHVINLGLPNFQESDLDNVSISEDNTLLSSARCDENFIQLTGDISSSAEISENMLAPFISQMIELPDGNGHMIELKPGQCESITRAEVHQSDSALNRNQESNDVIIYKSNSDRNEVVKTCDVLLANSADNLLAADKQHLSSMGPLDIQIMLSDNGNLINLSDAVDETSNQISDCQSYHLNNESVNNNFQNNSSEIINIQQVALQKPNVLSDIYTITGDETSLKIISLEQYDSLFMKAHTNSFSNSDCNDSSSYNNFNSTLTDDTGENMNNEDGDSNNIYIPDGDDGLFSFDNNYELTGNVTQSAKVVVKKGKKRKKNSEIGKSHFTLTDNVNNQCIKLVDSNFNFTQTPTLHIDNNTDVYLDNSTETFFPSTTGTISNIITLDGTKESITQGDTVNGSNVINFSSVPKYSKKYFIASNGAEKELHLKPLQKSRTGKYADAAVSKESTPQYNENFEFLHWLSSVTESINQTMHYQFNGKPDALVFHIPEAFYDCLLERISNFGHKKRLPNMTSVFERKKAVPLGKFTMYTWKIINIFHVKNIFDTSSITLEITRFFKRSPDGTYTHVDNPIHQSTKSQHQNLDENKPKKKNNPVKIIPRETFITYLKVGNTSAKQEEPTPFCIEWIPDILPKTKVGELRIKFEFGHKNNYIPQKPNANIFIVKNI